MEHRQIPGTPVFDGEAAQKGYALNKMCFSFNNAANRAEFLRDEDGYCRKFGLTPQQRIAVKRRNVLEMIQAGGNVYYLAKLAGIFGLNVQDIGAQRIGRGIQAETAGRGEGQVLSENTAMLAMCRELGFQITTDPNDPDTCIVKLVLGAR
jgi:protocatechuate 4,5-dioxygenase, alpha chain